MNSVYLIHLCTIVLQILREDALKAFLLTGKIPGREDAVDFRLLLIDLLQQALTEKISKSLPSVIDREPGAKKNVLDDFNTARAWTRMSRNMVDRNALSGTPHRIFNIDIRRIFSEEAA